MEHPDLLKVAINGFWKWWPTSKLRDIWHALPLSKDFARMLRISKYDNWSNRYLLPGRLWLDTVDVVITTKCNLRCKGCHHLMPYYRHPYHMDKDKLIAAMRKLNACVEWFDHYNFLGGEPFLNPDLKYFLEEAPSEKCNKIQITTNATIVPNDPELLDVMRRKKVHVLLSQYPSNQQRQSELIALLEREGIQYHLHTPIWTDYGEPINYHRSRQNLMRQFNSCPVKCKQLYDGKLYYCFRSCNTYDLGFCGIGRGEAVDLLNNTRSRNRRQVRRLMWRHKPVEACQYCLRGTDQNIEIVRGES